MRPDVEHIGNCIILNNLSMERKMLLTTTLVVITQLEKRLLTLYLIVSESWPMLALVFKVSFSFTLLEEEPDLALLPCCWNVYLLTTERSRSSSLLFIPL